MKNLTTIKNIKVFEEDLENAKKIPHFEKVEFDKKIKIYQKGGVCIEKNQYLVFYKEYSKIKYDDLVNALIREKYNDSEEFAILRKSINNPQYEQFIEYNSFAEECKKQAKEFIQERDGK